MKISSGVGARRQESVIEIGDRQGSSFKIHISTPTGWGQVVSGLGGYDDGMEAYIDANGIRYTTRSKLPSGVWRARWTRDSLSSTAER
jgi:hypothetical protein